MSGDASASEDIVSLQSAITHLQREYEQLNQVVIEQSKLIQSLRESLAELETRLEASGDDQQPFDPGLERPPHY